MTGTQAILKNAGVQYIEEWGRFMGGLTYKIVVNGAVVDSVREGDLHGADRVARSFGRG
jgi:hypothetical protein